MSLAQTCHTTRTATVSARALDDTPRTVQSANTRPAHMVHTEQRTCHGLVRTRQLPCASGTYATQEAGTRGLYVQYGGSGAYGSAQAHTSSTHGDVELPHSRRTCAAKRAAASASAAALLCSEPRSRANSASSGAAAPRSRESVVSASAIAGRVESGRARDGRQVYTYRGSGGINLAHRRISRK